MATVPYFSPTYLLQQDVLVDDSLVPLGVGALAAVFGPPLVLGAGGGRGKSWGQKGGKEVGRQQKSEIAAYKSFW